MERKKMTENESLQYEKIKRYCAYQERCKQDVYRKLKEWKADKETIERMIDDLVSEGYVNEERFAKMFVQGKFNIKSWGRQKIITELKRRNISGGYIKQSIGEIDAKLYLEKLNRLTSKWLREHNQEADKDKMQKLFRFLLSKGYEQDEIWKVVKENTD